MTSEDTFSSNMTWSDTDRFRWHGTEMIIIPLIIVTGVLGNMAVFYIYHFRLPSDTVTLVKRMLSVLDLITLLMAMPIILHLILFPRAQDFVPLCRFASFTALTSSVNSSFVLVIIAIDRFKKLCLIQTRGFSSLLTKKLFAASSAVSVLLNLPTCWLFGQDIISFKNYNVQTSNCFIDNHEPTLLIVWAAVLSIVFLANTAVLVVLYARVINSLCKLSRKRDEMRRRGSIGVGSEMLKREKRSRVMRTTAIVFILVTVVYFCSYAPYFVTMVLSIACPELEESMGPGLKIIYDVCKLCPLINNVANPLIYSLNSETFRDELKGILTLNTCKTTPFQRRRAFSSASMKNKSFEAEGSHSSDSRFGSSKSANGSASPALARPGDTQL